MVDQANVKSDAAAVRRGTTSAPRAVAHNMAELTHDAIALAELQVELLRHDMNQALGRLVVPVAVLAGAVALLLSCVPLALVCVALFIAEGTVLTNAQAFLLTLAMGLVVGGLAAFAGAWFLRKSFAVLARSRDEFLQNVRWIKTMFKRIGSTASRRPLPEYDDYEWRYTP